MDGLGGRGEQGKSGTACAGSSVSDTGLLSTKPEKWLSWLLEGKGINLNKNIFHNAPLLTFIFQFSIAKEQKGMQCNCFGWLYLW